MIRYTFRLGTMDQVKGVCLIPTYTHPLITSGNRGKYIIIKISHLAEPETY